MADKIEGNNNMECELNTKINDIQFTMNEAVKIDRIHNNGGEPIIKSLTDVFTMNKAEIIAGINNKKCEPIAKINEDKFTMNEVKKFTKSIIMNGNRSLKVTTTHLR